MTTTKSRSIYFNCSMRTTIETRSLRKRCGSKWNRTMKLPTTTARRLAARLRRCLRRTASKTSRSVWMCTSEVRCSTRRSAPLPPRPNISCSSPSSFGMMSGGSHVAQQQHSPLPSVAHFSHNHHHHHLVQHHSQGNLQMSMNQIFTGPGHQYVAANAPHNFLFKDSTIYEGMGGMGLAAAQQQLKARNKMHEMALRQHLITDQNMQANGELVLSAEERRTLVQEGYPIPQKYPLSKSEEEALKIVRRKIKNKLSAQESRRKRKEYIDALESRLHCFSEENKSLKNQVAELQATNRGLQTKLNQYERNEKM